MKEKILLLIREIYCAEYTGYIKVKDNGDGYTLILGLNNWEKPVTLSKQGTEEEFLDFIKDELKKSKFNSTEYYYGYKTDPLYDEYIL